MPNPTSEVSEMDPTQQILGWYTKLYSRRVDLVGDFAGSERFLIHGESLLLHCFSDQHIDFDPGYQLLHASYTVEKFLHGLVSRGCNFHIAFFDEHQDLCVPQNVSPAINEKYLLARAAIIRHLRINLQNANSDIDINTFPAISSESFQQYLQKTDLYFVLCHDGASFKDQRGRIAMQKGLNTLQDEDDTSCERQQRYRSSFRTLIYSMMQQGYSTALINGLEWQDTKVITTVVEPSRLMPFEVPSTNTVKDDDSNEDPSLLHKSLQTIRASGENAFTEREYLTVLVASKIATKSETYHGLSIALLRHTAVLSAVRLSDRNIDSPEITPEVQGFVLDFCREARMILEQATWAEDIEEIHATCDIADLIDGRLFASCLQAPSIGTSELFKSLQAAAASLGVQEEPAQQNGTLEVSKKGDIKNDQSNEATSYAVLPFSNDVFDEHLKPIKLVVDKSAGRTDPVSAKIFREVSHWHNQRRIDQKQQGPPVKDPKAEKRALRRNQFFMAEMTSYAASLTNAVGKVLEPEIITTGAKSKAPPSRTPTPVQKQENSKPQKGSKNAKGSRKELMLANIAAESERKDEESAKKYLMAWATFCDGLKKQEAASRYEKAKQYLNNLNDDLKRRTLEAEVRLYMLSVLLEIWTAYCRKSKKHDGMHVAALIFDMIREFSKLTSVTGAVAKRLKLTIEALKLPPMQVPAQQGDRKLPFEFALDELPAVDLSIPLTSEEFQLLHCGPYFDRTMDSAPDPRVPFEPDAWQRKVLDEIDARRSLLVIAPTSAGKTFISFYAMKQVLEFNEQDILVYVAPTKALVNQIAAEVQARFSKQYKYANSVWGIHTRDYRINNPTGCQILVTVPHILQIMLLAPNNANSWSKRIKWIIFDEVHCIGQAEDGLIWEQLLLMAPCPIIALSATIGNAEAFNDWLESTQKAAGNELVMVEHKHRYSDLRKYLYTPPAERVDCLPLPSNRAFAQLALNEGPEFTFLHPITSLTNRARGMPTDLTLEARDCFTLWKSMSKHQTAQYLLDESLNPSTTLPKVMKKVDIIEWQASLKTVLRAWMEDVNSPFEEVLKDLQGSLVNSMLVPKNDRNTNPSKEDFDVDEMELNHDVEDILPLLASLNQQDALPGIIFNYDRGVCERMCQTLLTQLTDAETAWKESSPKWQEKLRDWEEWKKEAARQEKQGVRGSSKGMTKEDKMREAASQEVNPFASFDPDRPQEGFHFANNKKCAQEELREYEKEMRYRGVDEWLLDGLRRGIGVHHAGMNRKYRYVVEMLFRRGYLRVVIATGTLALGINMPCKTVVFSGDSIFLTALNFRQAAGRAGRRGFDMLGNVVFHGVSLSKVQKLISSRLPDLNGHFSITTTLVLRLFTLLHGSEHSAFAVRSINALLSQPRLYLGGADAKMTVLHHLRFSIEYLRRQSLLDSQGVPLNFAGAVSHLYFTENSSFAFHALLKDGYFHELCAKIDTSKEAVLRELMLTLSHLFGRRHCRQADQETLQVVKGSPSIVFLPSMPEQAKNILRNHNKTTLDIFTAYVRTFVDEHIKEPDNTLPLTSVVVGGDSSINELPQRTPTKVRSSFVALSGCGDKFESIHDLCSTTRSGVFLEEAVIPHVGLYPEDSDLPLNAYLYDFFMHGNSVALTTANRIRKGDIWFALNDLSMVLATIVTSLSNFMKLSTESDLDFIDVRGGGDDEEENKEDRLLPSDSSVANFSTAGSVASSNVSQQRQVLPVQTKKSKKKVMESWEDEDESEEDAGENWDDGEGSDEEPLAWEEGAGLLNVLKAFKTLKDEFDTKFKAMWA